MAKEERIVPPLSGPNSIAFRGGPYDRQSGYCGSGPGVKAASENANAPFRKIYPLGTAMGWGEVFRERFRITPSW